MAGKLKTLSSENDEAEKAITYLYQINELDNLKGKLTCLLNKLKITIQEE